MFCLENDRQSKFNVSKDVQAHRQEGFKGVRANPAFSLPKHFIFTAYILSVLPFESGALVSLLLSNTAVQTCLVAAIHGGSARNACESYLRCCDGRTRVNACINKSLVQALESCPSDVTLLAVLPNLV